MLLPCNFPLHICGSPETSHLCLLHSLQVLVRITYCYILLSLHACCDPKNRSSFLAFPSQQRNSTALNVSLSFLLLVTPVHHLHHILPPYPTILIWRATFLATCLHNPLHPDHTHFNLKDSSEMLVTIYKTTQSHNPADHSMNAHYCKKNKGVIWLNPLAIELYGQCPPQTK
jgi:hypothetical protein